MFVFSLLGSRILPAQPLLGPDWQQEAAAAPWQARDSAGEVAYRNRLWILGGWFDSFSAPPRDVWSSADGREWRQDKAEAPWNHSDLPMTAVFRGRMWLLGGWYNGRLPGHAASNAVWSSGDGKNWTKATANAGWSPRLAAGVAVFRGRIWILGGTENYYFGDNASLKNDVWSSADGVTWRQETANAPWSPRAYHQAVVHNGRLWVMGGGNYVPEYRAENDVWSSADGVHWERATAKAPWSPRLWFSAVAYRGLLWVLGGWSKVPEQNWGDVWFSRDGVTWTELKANKIWKERHEHSALVHRDRLWVVAGHAKPLSREVWSLFLPKDFPRTPRRE